MCVNATLSLDTVFVYSSIQFLIRHQMTSSQVTEKCFLTT